MQYYNDLDTDDDLEVDNLHLTTNQDYTHVFPNSNGIDTSETVYIRSSKHTNANNGLISDIHSESSEHTTTNVAERRQQQLPVSNAKTSTYMSSFSFRSRSDIPLSVHGTQPDTELTIKAKAELPNVFKRRPQEVHTGSSVNPAKLLTDRGHSYASDTSTNPSLCSSSSTLDSVIIIDDINHSTSNDVLESLSALAISDKSQCVPFTNEENEIPVKKRIVNFATIRDVPDFNTSHTSEVKFKANLGLPSHSGHRVVEICAKHRVTEEDVISKFIVKQDNDGDNILFIAIILKRTDMVIMLVNFLVDYKLLRVYNMRRQTCLHLAALTNNYTVTRRLMVAGAEVKSQDINGNTALHIACMRGYKLVVQTLLRPISFHETKLNKFQIPYQPIPQDMEIRNYEGQTSLYIAIYRKQTEIANLLLDVDADINTTDMKTGKTCLHIAAELGDISLVKFVLSKHGLKLDAKTYSGYTATEIAYYREHYNVVYILQCEGASKPRSFDLIETSDSDSD